jgi:DNA-binding helix-hairpin-helix protein with protein kinase domain
MHIILGNKQILLSKQLGDGLAGTVWAHPTDRAVAIKIYKDLKYCEPERIEWLCHHPPPVLWESRTPTFAWPIAPVYEATTGELDGYSMLRVHGALPLQAIVDPRTRMPAIKRRFLWKVACSSLKRSHTLHLMKHIAGDSNLNNILVNRRGIVTLLDVDSTSFEIPGGAKFITGMNVPEVQPPELIGPISASIDRGEDQDAWTHYTLTWRLLHEGEQPFDCQYCGAGRPLPLSERIREGLWTHSLQHPKYRPKTGPIRFSDMPGPYQQLMRRMFLDGHSDRDARPTVTELLTCLQQFCPWGTRLASVGWLAWQHELKRGLPNRSVRRVITWPSRQKLQAGAAGLAVAGVLAVGLTSDIEPTQPPSSGRAPATTPIDPLKSSKALRGISQPDVKSRTGNGSALPTPALWQQALSPNRR